MKRCVKEGTFDVDLMKFEVIIERKHNEHFEGDHLSSGSKGLGIVGAFCLLKTLGAQSRLLFNGDIELVLLDLKDPGAIDAALFTGFLDNSPQVVVIHIGDFFLYGFLPEGRVGRVEGL